MSTPFTLPIRVLYGDTDAGGVVYNANYLRYFEAGRTEFMRERIIPYQAIEEMGIIMPVVESWLRYKAPALYDDLIFVETRLDGLSLHKCKFSYRIYRKEENRKKLLVKGYTVLAPITKEGGLTRIPQSLFQQMEMWLVKTQTKQ